MRSFQIFSLLVPALVFSQICWIYVIHFLKKDNAFFFSRFGNMLVIEWEISSLIIVWLCILKMM